MPAVVLSRSREWTSAIVAQQTPPVAVKTDGRKRRWHQHKVERRNELVDGTLVAIRQRGSNVSMDEIAAEIGVSKTVLYRYFVDKNDLTTAVMMRFAQTTLIPNMAAALSSNLQGYELTREVIKVYVETVAAEPEPYRFVMANNSASKNKVIANSEEIIARMLAVMLRRQMVDVGMDTGGVEPWAYHTVGGVQLATHSWMSHPRMSSDELIDYLTMLSWSALCGIVIQSRAGDIVVMTTSRSPRVAWSATSASFATIRVSFAAALTPCPRRRESRRRDYRCDTRRSAR